MVQYQSDAISDALYVTLADKKVAFTREIDSNRFIDYAEDGSAVGIDILEVSAGVELSDLPHSEEIIDRWIELILEEFDFENPVDVLQFLRVNQFLIGILLSAQTNIRRYFGPETSLSLELLVDAEDESRELFILIDSNLSVEQSQERLVHLDQEWWLAASSAGRCLLNLDLKHTEIGSDANIRLG